MSNESLRKLIDLAIACGRKRLNVQTNFVHHFNHPEGDETPVTIPTVENILFALALFRSRTAENIHEAKALLERILPFQCAGNFPVYLHEFPNCRDRYLGYHLLPPLYWIISQFHHILGQELKARLEGSARALMSYVLATQEAKPAPGQIAIKAYAAAEAFGKYWQLNEGVAKIQFGAKSALMDRALWHCPAHLGESMAALQLSETAFPEFWQHISNTWDRATCAYCGPALKEYQQGFEPQTTLYDLYLGYLTDSFSARALADGIHLLQGALIHHSHHPLPDPQPTQGIVKHDSVVYAVAERKEGWNLATDKSFHPLRMQWGNAKRVHTFVCQGGNSSTCLPQISENVDLLFDLGDPIEVEDREKSREIAFYLDLSDDHRITVNGTPATTFQITDEIIIESSSVALSLKFQVEGGEGMFMGHLMKGNRPSQIALKGADRYNAYDWQIFLRTIRRTHPCRVRAIISFRGEHSAKNDTSR